MNFFKISSLLVAVSFFPFPLVDVCEMSSCLLSLSSLMSVFSVSVVADDDFLREFPPLLMMMYGLALVLTY